MTIKTMEGLSIWILLTFIKVVLGQTEIDVGCGQLFVQGYSYCEIQHDNEIITYKGPARKVFPSLRFGLISYKCDHTAGYFMSNIDCKNCNFKCEVEELAENEACHSDPAQFWCGLFAGTLFSLVIAAFIFKYLGSVVSSSGGTQSEGEGFRKKARTSDSETTRRKTIISALTGILLVRSAEACDVTVAMNWSNVTTVCEGSVCKTPPSSLNVRKGFEICVENHFGEKVSIEVSGIEWRVRYQLAYYTSDYSVNFKFLSYCCDRAEPYESCLGDTNQKPCYQRAIAKLSETDAKNKTVGAFCFTDVMSYTEVKCVYTNEIEGKGNLYGILKKTRASATIKLTVNHANFSEVLSINDLDPTVFLKLPKFKHSLVTIPITMLGLPPPKMDQNSLTHGMYGNLPDSPRSLLHPCCDGKLYLVDSADAHRAPKDDIFGEFQRSLDYETVVKPAGAKCKKKEGCDCQCSAQKANSKISDFESRRGDFQQLHNYIVREDDFSVVDAFEPSQSDEVSLRFGVWSVNDFERMEGQCDIEFFGNYGCTSCDEKPYVIFKATKINRLGLVPFYSNCSSDRVSVKCDSEPTRLVIEGKPNACHFRLPTMKKQFTVELKYSKLGHQVQTRKQLNCTATFTGYGEAMGHLVTSATFIKTFAGTVILFFVSFAVLILVFVLRLRFRELPHTVHAADDLLDL